MHGIALNSLGFLCCTENKTDIFVHLQRLYLYYSNYKNCDKLAADYISNITDAGGNVHGKVCDVSDKRWLLRVLKMTTLLSLSIKQETVPQEKLFFQKLLYL